MGHGHHHHHHHEHQGEKDLWIAFFLNFVFAIIEIIGGIYTNSMAILSDAVHDLGDSFSILIAVVLERISQKIPDKAFTYGYKRFSILGAFVTGLILLVGSLFIMGEAVERIMNPETVNPEGMVPLAILGITVNGFAAWRLSKDTGLNQRMVMMHLLEDILGWVAVLVVAVVLIFKPWFILDSLLSILISVIILRGVWGNMKKVGGIFLQKFPAGLEIEKIIAQIKEHPEVVDVHEIRGWSLDESHFSVSFHVRVDPCTQMKQVDRIRREIRTILDEAHVQDAAVEFESTEFDCS